MNWGTKIVLGMLAFMLFIIGMAVYMFRVHGRDALVEEDYYEKGINYNAEYDAKKNVLEDDAKPLITVTNNHIIVQLKESARYDLVLMRPSSRLEDVELKGKTTGRANLILCDRTKMARGLWFLNLNWHSGNKDYLYKYNITL